MDIVIISGFLGGGKTTVLNNLIEDVKLKGKTAAVLMNEFGEQSIDTYLIDKGVQVSELINGCICCEMKTDVTNQLHKLYLEYQPDIVFIECSGIAHPSEVLDACLTPVLTPFSEIISILGVLDVSLYNNLESYPKVIQKLLDAQMKHSSNIILNKSDLINSEEMLNVINTINTKYPNIEYFITNYGEVTIDNIKIPEDLKYKKEYDTEIYHGSLGHLLYQFSHPWDKNEFIEWLKTLPENIYRVKGFLNFNENKKNSIIQYANYHLDIQSTNMHMNNYLVIIGHNLDNEQLVHSLNRYKNNIVKK